VRTEEYTVRQAYTIRPLTFRQALTCEAATNDRCRCRCGGAAHGTKRSQLVEFYEKLPETDPHRIPTKSRQLELPAPLGRADGPIYPWWDFEPYPAVAE
jgi:hypothetical protein